MTGHRDILETDALTGAVGSALRDMARQRPGAPRVLLSSLAQGADQLCALLALGLGFSLVCPLPRPLRDYRSDFQGAALARFDALIGQASRVFTAPAVKPEGQGLSFGYRQAGFYIAAHCHTLLALWDGRPFDPEGCGTAETVAFALGCLRPAGCTEPAPDCAVWHIMTPRTAMPINREAYRLNILRQGAADGGRAGSPCDARPRGKPGKPGTPSA